MESEPRATDPSRCEANALSGERCRKRAVRGRFCLVHAGAQNMRELGRRGGRARTRPGMGGKQLPATLRDRLRESVDEDKLAQVLVSGLESESARERLDVAKLVLAELHDSTRSAATACTCQSDPGAWCGALEPHGYRSKGGSPIDLEELVALAFECGIATADGEVRVAGVPVRSTPRNPYPPQQENRAARDRGYPPAPAISSEGGTSGDPFGPGGGNFDETEAGRWRRRYGSEVEGSTWRHA